MLRSLELLEPYTGQYRLQENIQQYGDYTGQWQVNHLSEVIFIVQRTSNGLLIRDPVGNEFHYYPQAIDSFFALESDGDVIFGRDAQGQVSHIDLIFSHASFQAANLHKNGVSQFTLEDQFASTGTPMVEAGNTTGNKDKNK